ncbi:unnamed protein product [Gongylonema pulchrum]|uniref:UAE_UbL domain-containing protein n=1 Tax=Gongylonema pulchrum TaxID=637853 RepID=A0A183E1Q4_9BILA|nr:unnamed protein product [Gongylonema pulchrum]
MLEMLNRMHYSTDEIVIDAKTEVFAIRNHITRDQDRDAMVKTEGKIPITDFHSYTINQPSEIVVSMKELKGMLSFADYFQLSVSIYFDQPGNINGKKMLDESAVFSPLVIALEENINFTGEVVLATGFGDITPYDVDSEIPIQIVHTSARQLQQAKQRNCSQTLSELNPSGLVTIDDCSLPAKNKKILQNSNVLGTDELMEDERLLLAEDDMRKILKINGDNEDGAGPEKQPSHGPALFRYLFAFDESTFDEEDFLLDAAALAPDSDPDSYPSD